MRNPKDTLEWQAEELSKATLEAAELKRKLDAANSLLHDKDVTIADLRQKKDDFKDCLKNINSLVYGILGR